jgi:lipopolysaccharide export system protein LptA
MNRSIGCLLLTSALIIGWTGLASAQEQSSQPLEVTAQDSLEWHRTEKFFIAKGDALASQGDAQISGQTLTAFYSDTNKSNFDIHKLEADTNVKIDSRGTQVLGDHLVYDLPSGQATMTGKDLKIIAPDQTVTARDKFEYDMNKGEFKAYGNALVRRAQDTL